MLRWLYKTYKTNRGGCKHWRGWSRENFVEHLRLLYPQLSNAAVKSYLEMIKEIPFQYDLDNPVLELKFQSELSKIVKHYDSLTISEEAEAVKILLGKIINCGDRDWYITACGHLIENWNPIIDIRDVDFPY